MLSYNWADQKILLQVKSLRKGLSYLNISNMHSKLELKAKHTVFLYSKKKKSFEGECIHKSKILMYFQLYK
jgi:hypothetical protein